MSEIDSGRERWRMVAGYGDYEVSDHGRVRSLKRAKPLIMALVPDSDGYPTVKLCDGCGGKTRYKVHRLVCRAFHGEGPAGHEVAHLDGAKTNARADNLAWCTPKENHSHKLRHGTRQAGELNGRARVNQEKVAVIRRLAAEGRSERAISREVGISKTAVHRIVAGETWR